MPFSAYPWWPRARRYLPLSGQGAGQPVVQLIWTSLPQGFKNSPTLFNEALSEDLYEYQICHPEVILLQYVDDLMLAVTTEEARSCVTGDLLILAEALVA